MPDVLLLTGLKPTRPGPTMQIDRHLVRTSSLSRKPQGTSRTRAPKESRRSGASDSQVDACVKKDAGAPQKVRNAFLVSAPAFVNHLSRLIVLGSSLLMNEIKLRSGRSASASPMRDRARLTLRPASRPRIRVGTLTSQPTRFEVCIRRTLVLK